MPWSFSQQGVILSSFFWGLLFQIPAGYFSHRFGTLYPLFGGITIASFATILMPVLALNSNWIIVCLSRVVNGLAQVKYWTCCVFSTVGCRVSCRNLSIFVQMLLQLESSFLYLKNSIFLIFDKGYQQLQQRQAVRASSHSIIILSFMFQFGPIYWKLQLQNIMLKKSKSLNGEIFS